MVVLGISAFYHDAAAVLTVDGRIVAACQEERLSRVKHDPSFPRRAVAFCLSKANITLDDVDRIAFYDKPFLKFERLLETSLAVAPLGALQFIRAMPVWLKEKLFLKETLARELGRLSPSTSKKALMSRLRFCEHHVSHGASAFFPSPFDEAAVLTVDGVGEWTTTSLAVGRGRRLDILKELHFPHSLGLLYSAFTAFCGFEVNDGEYKLMGLAPYGTPRHADTIRTHLIDIRSDGSFRLNMDYFSFTHSREMTNRRFAALFDGPARRPDGEITAREQDLAASIQLVTTEVVCLLAAHLKQLTGSDNLCLAGGVALNCVANGALLRSGPFEHLWIQPAAGDAGGALGAALAVHHMESDSPIQKNAGGGDAMGGAFLGPSSSTLEVVSFLDGQGAPYTRFDDDDALLDLVAAALADGKVVGWHSGPMEFGPRALGGRSILADPRSPDMQSVLNHRIKFRESFRPFAPAVLATAQSQWFDLPVASPYMLLVADVRPRQPIPAVTHVDGTARVQSVNKQTNPRFHRLLEAFERATGCPVLINTSFNVKGEPVVCTPEDSYRCFMKTGMDLLVMENCLLYKSEQPGTRGA